jgi:hypothetical protein
MLIIKNIDRAVGMVCDGHVVASVGEVLAAGIPTYVFRFAHIPHCTNVSMWPYIEIMLNKIPESNGKYQLFAMTWQGVTYIDINEHEIAQLHLLADQIGCVLKKLKTYLLFIQKHRKNI